MRIAQKALGTMQDVTDKLTAIADIELGSKHTHDSQGSFKKEEVDLAFRNHGAHMEGLDLDTTPIGMHYVLQHFDMITKVNETSYRLKIKGLVQNPLSLSMEDITTRLSQKLHIVLECSGNGRTLMKPRYNQHVPWNLQAFGCAEWTCFPLRDLLNEAKVKQGAVDVVFSAMDSGVHENKNRYYQRAIAIDDPVIDDCFLAYEMNGVPLPPQHGYPIRLLQAGWYGDGSVKHLKSIEVISYRHKGFAMTHYTYSKNEQDTLLKQPVQEIRPRAMMHEPGIPHFYNRERRVLAGTVRIEGKAWVGGGRRRHVSKVEFSDDDGRSWQVVHLEARKGTHVPYGWQHWHYDWNAALGRHILRCRAIDNQDNYQKVELSAEDWNYHGMADDGAQRVLVEVVANITYEE